MSKVAIPAFTVPLLHAAKYPSSAVCGVLLGTNTTHGIQVETAIPFFHHWTTVTPMLEVALKQVRFKKRRIQEVSLMFSLTKIDRNLC